MRRRATYRSVLIELTLAAVVIGGFYLLLWSGALEAIGRWFGEMMAQNFRPPVP